MTEKQDLRVVRTHKMIRAALIQLLKTQEFDNIAVQDIVDLAMVNRATFYKYYSGKSDLAGVMIAEFKANYQATLKARFAGSLDVQTLMNTAIPALYEQRELILALWKIKTKRHHLWDDMYLMIKQNFIHHQQTKFPNRNFDYQGEILATMILKTAHYYFSQDLPIPIKQVWAEIGEMLAAVQN
ncbi:TetR family transcriptional regulator [Necropsobacter rosorum]|uniref:TetR/AcrR family transcriptional regulator n=1 Tax=Necropsobacter rosorum TaxID=908285 RepID=UPI000509F663